MALRNLAPRVELSPRKLRKQSTEAFLKIVPDLSIDCAPGTSKAFVAFILGIIAVRKKKEHSFLVYLSILIGLLTILFLLLHSLFISD